MSNKLLVKYLDPSTGKYEHASVVDIGDLDNLKTQVKTDLVSAINSITLSGEVPENIQSQIDGINSQITDSGKAGLTDRQLAEIQIKLDANIVDIMNQVNELNAQVEAELKKDIADLSVDYTSKIEAAQNDYNAKVSEINLNLDEAKSDIVKTKSDLLGIKDELSNSDLNYVKVTQDINKINGSLSTKVESSDFDLMQSKVTKNTTDIAQTKENITLLATKSSLDLATERITNAESNIKINSDGIESRVTYEELNSEIQNVNKYGNNMLIGTRNWSASWVSNDLSQSYITNDTYNHCKIQVINRKTGYHSTNVDGLIIGKTYTASVYFKTGSNSTISNPVFFVGNKEYTMDKVVEDTSLINNWKRVSVNFVATEVSFTTSIRFDFISSGDTGYLVSPKLEFGAMATPWKPYFEDDNESIIKNESSIKQNSDSIVSLVKSTTKIGEDVETNKTQITQTSEKVETQAVKIQKIDGKVSENKASIAVANGRIDLKVSQTDVNQSIANTNLDTKNRIINSDFSRGFSNWNEISSGFSLKDIDSIKFASITRSGLTSTSIASIASDKFQVDNGNKLNFNFNFMSLNLGQLDDKNIFTIEIFDINDIRVFSNTFSLNNLNGNTNLANGKIVNLAGKYTINRSDAAKARVKFQINKNGNVNFSKINLQKGDVLDSNWAQAPEDILLYRVESQTAIEQTSKDILLRAKQTDLDTSNSRIKSNESSIKIANDGITQLTTGYNAINGRITKAESSITQNANAITQKVSSTDVENILTGKAYATKSEVVQTSNSLTSTIAGVRTDVEGISIGGQNLATQTITPISITGTNTENQITSNYVFIDKIANIVTTNDFLTLSFSWVANANSGSFTPRAAGKPYTFGDIIKSTGTNSDKSMTTNISPSNQSGKVVIVFKVNSSVATSGFGAGGFRLDFFESGKNLTISNYKLERGNKATDWSSADVDKANQTQVTQMVQDLNGFKTTVSSTYLTTTSASNTYPTKGAVSGTYLNKGDASSTYLNKNDASNTYPTKTTVTSQIKQSATDITNSVQSWTNGKLTGYSTIQQTNNSITSAVSGKADKTQITQLSNQIISSVSSVKNDLNNLTVGGENLLIDTDIGDLAKVNAPEKRYFSDAGNTIIKAIGFKKVSDSTTPSGYVVEATSIGGGSGGSGRRIAFYFGSGSVPFVKGETYTMSCYARKISGNPKIPFQYGNSTDGYNNKGVVNVVSTNWKQYSFTFVYDFNNPSTAHLGGISGLTAGTLQSCGFKVERGNKATSWGLSQYELATVTELSQLSQDLSGFKTTVSSTYLNKTNASNTYPTKDAVANTYPTKTTVTSQIKQSATDITNSVQSWTNNKLTAYSTTQQTANSITNAVANKADKSQITQLSGNINLKVSKGDVVSQINLEAGKTLINSNKIVLNANTTEIKGNAFIRGDMIVDKSLNAKKIATNSLSAISAILGDVTAGTYTSWNFSGTGAHKYLNGVYLYDGHLRSISIENSTVTDPNKNLTSKSYLIRGSDMYGGVVTFFNNKITTSAKPNDLLKGSSFFSGSNQAAVLDSSRNSSGVSALDIKSDNVKISGYAYQTIPWTKMTSHSYYKVMFGRVNIKVDITSGKSRDNIFLGGIPDQYKSPNGNRMFPAQAWKIGVDLDKHVQHNSDGSLFLINPNPNTKYVFEISYTL